MATLLIAPFWSAWPATANTVTLFPMDLTQRSQQTRLILQNALKQLLTASGVKSAVFYYVVARYLLKTYRHVIGNGVTQSAVDAYKWISLVRSFAY